MNTLKQLENAPRNLVLYFWTLVGAVVDDWTMMTLTFFCVLLAFLTSALIAVVVFFGAHFVLRLVAHIAEAIALNARAQHQAAYTQTQAMSQVATALAQRSETVIESYNPPDPMLS